MPYGNYTPEEQRAIERGKQQYEDYLARFGGPAPQHTASDVAAQNSIFWYGYNAGAEEAYTYNDALGFGEDVGAYLRDRERRYYESGGDFRRHQDAKNRIEKEIAYEKFVNVEQPRLLSSARSRMAAAGMDKSQIEENLKNLDRVLAQEREFLKGRVFRQSAQDINTELAIRQRGRYYQAVGGGRAWGGLEKAVSDYRKWWR